MNLKAGSLRHWLSKGETTRGNIYPVISSQTLLLGSSYREVWPLGAKYICFG